MQFCPVDDYELVEFESWFAHESDSATPHRPRNRIPHRAKFMEGGEALAIVDMDYPDFHPLIKCTWQGVDAL